MGKCGGNSLFFATFNFQVEQAIYSFSGSFSYTIDHKNRINIPAKFRKGLGLENDRTFVVTKGFDKCIYAYPAVQWQVVQSEMLNLNAIKNRSRSFIRKIQQYTTHVQHDSQGRIQIPEVLLNFAEITNEAVIIGIINKIEIWAPNELEKWENEMAEKDDFEDLANDISF